MKKVSDLTEVSREKDPKDDRESQSSQKESMKELVKRKLKRVHEEIIAPPGQ